MSFKKIVEQAATKAAIDASPALCQCDRTELRERAIRGGSKQYVRQCLDCGEPVGNPAKQAGPVAPFDEDLRRIDLDRREGVRQAARQVESAQWWSYYEQYMAGPQWAAVRVNVLRRDKYICQGCFAAQATEVHHTSYANFGAEFAFELLSLCRPCHERFHAKDE